MKSSFNFLHWKVRAPIVIFTLLGALLVAFDAAAETPHVTANLRAADRHIIPSYSALAERTAVLNERAAAFCADPGETGLEQLSEGFHQAMDAWQSIQHIRFGPVEFLFRYNLFELWPDKRGSVGKHLAQLLAAADPEALAADRFARASVAVQGFSALERLLFGDKVSIASFGPDGAGQYRCAVVQAIAANLAEISAGLVDDWTRDEGGHRGYFATAAGGNAFYADEAELSGRLLNNIYAQMEVIVDQKLKLPLGESIDKARGKRAESWRSGRSLRNIRLNLVGLRALYREAFAPVLDDAALAAQMETAFDDALVALDAIEMFLFDAVTDPEGRAEVEGLRVAASTLKVLFSGPLPQALGISIGFNSLDGD